VDFDERDQVAQQFGVAPEQVERDHLISYLLAYLSEQFGDRIHFFGGTALARTHLPTVGSARTSTLSRLILGARSRRNWTPRCRWQ
jgi:predicted nucleotidyltransferase component of viral defense system